MKRRPAYKIFFIAALWISLIAMASCSAGLRGSKILSSEKVKGQKIIAINVTFYNSNNRMDSPTATLTAENQEEQIEGFHSIVMGAKGVSIGNEERFSPISDSSHLVEVVFENENSLDFYYYQEKNWIIWSNIIDEDGQRIVNYHFLSPKGSMEGWLSSIEL